MAWIVTEQNKLRWRDEGGPLGGFARGRVSVADKATSLGPISSADGVKWEIYVQNDGTVSATTSTDPT